MTSESSVKQNLLSEPESEPLERNQNRASHRHFKHHGKARPIDFVLAAKSDRDEVDEQILENYFRNLKTKKRLKISTPVLSQDEKTIFWHVYAPFDVLCDAAEDLNLRLPTVENDIEVTMWYDKFINKIKDWWDARDPFKVKDSYFSTPKTHFSDIFDKNRRLEFLNGKCPEKLFTNPERSRLVSYILEDTSFSDDADDIGKSLLLSLGVLSAAYPCHDGPLNADEKNAECINDRQKLVKEWGSFNRLFKYQPIHAIKDYFGVKVAFYYAWIGFYTTYLVPASLLGVIVFFFGGVSNLWFEPVKEICNPSNKTSYYMCPLCDRLCSYYLLKDFSCLYAKVTHLFDNDGSAFFAVFISIWSVVYLEYWKRRQWILGYKWHTMEFTEEEVVRPQFSAAVKKMKKNPVTGKLEPTMSKKEHMLKLAGGFSVVFFFVTLVIAALIGVIVYRAAIFGVLLTSDGTLRANSKLFVTGTAATLNLLVINILKLVYQRLAVMMTEWENPRTLSAYEKSFTIKMFWFQFCNTYSSVFYVAFFKSEIFVGWPGHYRRFGTNQKFRLEGCSGQGCFLELCLQLTILMGGQQLLGNFVEILWPFVKKRYNTWKHGIKRPGDIPVWEADYQLSQQDSLSLFWEYQEVALQYGFVTMFVAAFPLAPLIALITNLVEIRIDAINMLKFFRRPVAYKSQGIGVWYDILVTCTAVGVLVNGFVLSVTSEFIPRLVYKYEFSPDRTLKGYVMWSLSQFNVSDFTEMERPDDPTKNVPLQQPFCRFPGFHEPHTPYRFNKVHWEIMTMRLVFAFLFQWTVTAASRILSWFIPDKPRVLDLKLKRQEFLAQEALRRYKILSGKRKPVSKDTNDQERSMPLSPDIVKQCLQKKKMKEKSKVRQKLKKAKLRKVGKKLESEKENELYSLDTPRDEVLSGGSNSARDELLSPTSNSIFEYQKAYNALDEIMSRVTSEVNLCVSDDSESLDNETPRVVVTSPNDVRRNDRGFDQAYLSQML